VGPAGYKPVAANLEEVTVVEGEERAAVRCSSHELFFIPDSERPDLVGADNVVTSGPKDAGEIRNDVFVEIEARPHEALNSTLPRRARRKP
jgi:hypothetical protein